MEGRERRSNSNGLLWEEEQKKDGPCGGWADAGGCAEEHMSMILFLYSCNDSKLQAL